MDKIHSHAAIHTVYTLLAFDQGSYFAEYILKLLYVKMSTNVQQRIVLSVYFNHLILGSVVYEVCGEKRTLPYCFSDVTKIKYNIWHFLTCTVLPKLVDISLMWIMPLHLWLKWLVKMMKMKIYAAVYYKPYVKGYIVYSSVCPSWFQIVGHAKCSMHTQIWNLSASLSFSQMPFSICISHNCIVIISVVLLTVTENISSAFFYVRCFGAGGSLRASIKAAIIFRVLQARPVTSCIIN